MTTREKYDNLLHSGMFFELFPNLSGNWEEDKLGFSLDLFKRQKKAGSSIENKVVVVGHLATQVIYTDNEGNPLYGSAWGNNISIIDGLDATKVCVFNEESPLQ